MLAIVMPDLVRHPIRDTLAQVGLLPAGPANIPGIFPPLATAQVWHGRWQQRVKSPNLHHFA